MLYGCEAWSLTLLREEHRLRVFKNRIQRRKFGPKRDENGVWKRLCNKELHSLYRSSYIVRVIKFIRLRWASHIVTMEENRSAFKVLTWEGNIRMDLKGMGINTRNWVAFALERDYWRALLNAALNLWVP